VAVVAVTLLTFLVSSLATERFRATARIVDTTARTDTSSGSHLPLATPQALVTTPAVPATASRRLDGESASSVSGKVSARLKADADLRDVRATDTSTGGAAAIANAVARASLDRRTATQLASIQRTRPSCGRRLRG